MSVAAGGNIAVELLRAAERGPDRVALRLRGGAERCDVSYGELRESVARAASMLRRAGVQEEQRVLIALPDCPELVVTFLGAIWTGAVAVLVNPFLRPADYEYFLGNTRARVVVTTETLADALAATPRWLEGRTVLTVAPGRRGSWWSALDAEEEGSPPFAAHPEDAAFWLYSSGTTGAPKGVVHQHKDIAFAVETYGRQILEADESAVFYATSKAFFAYGLGASLYFPLAVGASVVLSPDPFDPGRVWKNVMAERPTHFFSVPSAYRALLDHPEAPAPGALSFIRRSPSAGEGLPPPLFTAWKERFGIDILDGIGSTEMLHIYLSNRPGRCRPGSLGWPVPGYELRIVDERGLDVADETPGVILAKGGSRAAGYWQRGDATARAFLGDWYMTGDQGVRAADGSIQVLGRVDDMLKVSGQWVAPGDIEAVVLTAAGVRECGIVGRTRDDGLVELVAFVVAAPGADAVVAGVAALCAEKLPRYKRPSEIRLLDALPRTATGKLQHFRLREIAARSGSSGTV